MAMTEMYSEGGGGITLNPTSTNIEQIGANATKTYTIDITKDYILTIWQLGTDLTRVYVYSILKGIATEVRQGIGMSSITVEGTTLKIVSQSSQNYAYSLVALD